MKIWAWRTGLFGILCLLSLAAVFQGCDEKNDIFELIDMVIEIEPQAAQCIHPGESVEFSMLFVQRGTPPYTYAWNFGDGAIPNSDAEAPGQVTFPNKGLHIVELTVTDSENREATATREIRVKDNCGPPVALIDHPADDITVTAGTTIDFQGSATGGDEPYSYTWRFYGSSHDTVDEQNPAVAFNSEGVWSAILTVRDAAQDSSNAQVQITVTPAAGWIGSFDPPFTAPDGISVAGGYFGSSSSNEGMLMVYGTGGMVGFDIGTHSWTGNLLDGSFNVLSGVTMSGQTRDQRDILFGYTTTDAFITYWNPAGNSFGMTQFLPNTIVRDAVPYSDDPTAVGFVYTQPTSVRMLDFDPDTGFFAQAFNITTSYFPGLTGNLSSAFARDETSHFLTVSDGTPGQLFLSPRTFTAGTLIGEIGDTPRQIRCLDELCVISCFDSDELWIATWDASDVVTIVGSVDVGDGPIGIDLLSLDGGDVAVVSTGFLDHSYSITVLNSAGGLVSNTTHDAPAECDSPPHAAWVPGPERAIAITCHGSDMIYILDSGL
jgi:hypothetical protein